jgi:hypothetical protein
MAVNRTVLPNGTVQPQHAMPYETDMDANWALLDQWMGGRILADAGISGLANGLMLSTSATLTPGLTAGVLYAQGQRVPFASAPNPGAAPANGTYYLFYNSSTGFYYQTSPVAATAGDALIGQVVTGSTTVAVVTQATKIYGQVSAVPSAPGNFTLQHFLGRTPVGAAIRMTSSGAIWFQTPTDMDATNLFLVASDAGVTAKVQVW